MNTPPDIIAEKVKWEKEFNRICTPYFGYVSDQREKIDVFFEPAKLQKEIKDFITQVAEESRREELKHLIYVFEDIEDEANRERMIAYFKKRLSTLTKKESCACFCHIPESKGELKLICTRCNHQVSGECKYTQSKKEKHNG